MLGKQKIILSVLLLPFLASIPTVYAEHLDTGYDIRSVPHVYVDVINGTDLDVVIFVEHVGRINQVDSAWFEYGLEFNNATADWDLQPDADKPYYFSNVLTNFSNSSYVNGEWVVPDNEYIEFNIGVFGTHNLKYDRGLSYDLISPWDDYFESDGTVKEHGRIYLENDRDVYGPIEVAKKLNALALTFELIMDAITDTLFS
ncbi:MAG: hypothetical protein J4F36_13640 [Nitrosopumilaceae archaeon]|nr:hypothetical protein [Nitrosopumilaceae archaeon]